ncbi:MAG TPA: class I SAM-dependent methyltransferase [Flavisolibacter sp.]|nr:class I SAM-dependent methyltransferase [Flavisolibacter sp.]
MPEKFNAIVPKSADVNFLLGHTDIYLIDQIMKGTYDKSHLVLDAGCGGGRNLHWFIKNSVAIYGIDNSEEVIDDLKRLYKELPAGRFQKASVEALPFADSFFDAAISSAVLHFATGEAHFFAMITEMLRVLKRNGTLFIRMATEIGIENKVRLIGNGIYHLPDGSARFLLTRLLLSKILSNYPVTLLEEFKTVNVNDVRCMSTILLKKT